MIKKCGWQAWKSNKKLGRYLKRISKGTWKNAYSSERKGGSSTQKHISRFSKKKNIFQKKNFSKKKTKKNLYSRPLPTPVPLKECHLGFRSKKVAILGGGGVCCSSFSHITRTFVKLAWGGDFFHKNYIAPFSDLLKKWSETKPEVHQQCSGKSRWC